MTLCPWYCCRNNSNRRERESYSPTSALPPAPCSTPTSASTAPTTEVEPEAAPRSPTPVAPPFVPPLSLSGLSAPSPPISSVRSKSSLRSAHRTPKSPHRSLGGSGNRPLPPIQDENEGEESPYYLLSTVIDPSSCEYEYEYEYDRLPEELCPFSRRNSNKEE